MPPNETESKGDVFGSKIGSIFLKLIGWVSHFLFGFGFGKFPLKLKMSKFSIFSLRFKKISLGWVKKYPGQRQVGLLFTASQKYARVGSGSISRF